MQTAFRPGVRLSVQGSDTRISLPLMIQIEDNGPGVPEHLKAHLFDPFVTTKPYGTGLGLALVAKIISDHGGIIECDSEPKRTVFRVLLPMQDRAAPRNIPLEPEVSHGPRHRISSPTTTPRSAPCSIRRWRAPATRRAPPATPPRCGAG